MISVCMATYNGAKFIEEQIISILKQLNDEDEIIISDDGSVDNTIDIIKSINDSRIKILSNHREKTGMLPIELVTSNFENALKGASGDIIFLSDQDDVWLDNKVKISLEYLNDRGYDYIVSDCFITDSNLNIIANTRFDGSVTLNRWKALLKPTPYQGSCSAFKRAVLRKALPFPNKIQSHDRWIGFVASFGFRYKIIPEKLIYYRRHEANASTATSKSGSSSLYKIKTRMKYMKELTKRLIIGGG